MTVMNKKKIKSLSVILIALAVLISCSAQKEEKHLKSVKVYVDNSTSELLKPLFQKADSLYTEMKYEIIDTTAFGSMAMLLTDTSYKICIISRDYSPGEKETMATYGVAEKPRAVIARDALVFFVNKDYPADTISHEEILALFNDDKFSLKKQYPGLAKEPVFAVKNQYSSEYENLKNIVLNGKISRKILKPFSSVDSVKIFVAGEKTSIGVGYLSQLVNDTRFKMLKVGFTDSTGKRIIPRLVHQANIVQGFYPYEIKHYIYLYNDSNKKAEWLLRFLSKAAVAQKYFNEAGIVPAYGNFKIIMEQ
jgi:ABC-type phosphate transport system substrate-binding protein